MTDLVPPYFTRQPVEKLFVTDLDGTLLSPESRISDESSRIINRLSEQGVMITPATARTPATVEPLFSRTLTLPPAIVMTGAAMWDRPTQSYVNTQYLDESTAADVLAACHRNGLNPLIYTIGPDSIINAYFFGRADRREQKFMDERSRLKLKRIIVNQSGLDCLTPMPSTVLILSIGDEDAIYAAAEHLRALDHCSVSAYPDIFNHRTAYLEVMAQGVSKAAAVEKLRKQLGAKHLTVFGDNLNDLPMMAVADVAVAVDNALPEVKAAADIIIGPNSADSVARYIADHC